VFSLNGLPISIFHSLVEREKRQHLLRNICLFDKSVRGHWKLHLKIPSVASPFCNKEIYRVRKLTLKKSGTQWKSHIAAISQQRNESDLVKNACYSALFERDYRDWTSISPFDAVGRFESVAVVWFILENCTQRLGRVLDLWGWLTQSSSEPDATSLVSR